MTRIVHVAAPASSDAAGHAVPVSVVDDDVWVGESLTELLEAYGLDAVAYVSGSDFLADEQHRQSGCLVIDQHMPEIGGFDVVERLREEGVAIPTILITGKLNEGISERARQLGVLAVLEKPFAVARFLELARAGLACPR